MGVVTLAIDILKAVVTATDDSGGLQRVSVITRNKLLLDNVEVFEPHGFTSRLFVGAEGVLVMIGGDRSHRLFICGADRRYRAKDKQPGEVTISTDEGDYLAFRRGSLVTLKSATKITLDCPSVDIPNGDLTVNGISFLQHVHPENDNGGPTGVPQ